MASGPTAQRGHGRLEPTSAKCVCDHSVVVHYEKSGQCLRVGCDCPVWRSEEEDQGCGPGHGFNVYLNERDLWKCDGCGVEMPQAFQDRYSKDAVASRTKTRDRQRGVR